MVQPIDYSAARPTVNPIQQAAGIIGLQGAIQQQQQARQQQAMQQQAAQQQAAYAQALQGADFSDPRAFQNLAKQYPTMLEETQKFSKFQGQQQQQAVNSASEQMLRASITGDQNVIDQAIDKNAQVIASTGDPSMTPDLMKRISRENPQLFQSMMAGAYQTTGGDAQNLLNPTADMTPYQRELVRQKDSEQEIKKLELEEKRLDRQLKKETDDLKRQELEQKIADNQRKSSQAQEAVQKEKRQAINSTQQTLDSVNSLLNHPGLQSAVGKSSLIPSIPGTERANFDTALESFVGNLTMENMGVMKGVLSDSDIKMIRSASSGLSPRMSEKAFTTRLEKIKERLDKKLAEQGVSAEQQPSPQQQQQFEGAPQVGTVDSGYRYIGGDPSLPESWSKI